MLTRWLTKEAMGPDVVLWVLLTIVLHFASSLAMVITLEKADLLPEFGPVGLTIPSPFFPFILFGLALLEECIFRLPLALFITSQASLRLILCCAVILSIAFGLAHGHVQCLLIQGVGGMLWCLLFLKCGGLQGKYPKALCSTTMAHFLFNLNLSGLLRMEGISVF